jgi:hypothetical protein
MAGNKNIMDPFGGYAGAADTRSSGIDIFKDILPSSSNEAIYKINPKTNQSEEYVLNFEGKLIPITAFAQNLLILSAAERSTIQKKLKSFGVPLTVTDGGYDSTGNFEKMVVGYAQANTLRNYAFYQSTENKTKFSPTSTNSFINDFIGKGKDTSGGPKKTIDYNAPFTSAQAQSLSDNLAKNLLGRKATKAESALVLSSINNLMKNKPDTVTTSVSGDVQTIKRTTGVTQADIESNTESILKKSPEYKPYQIATTYYDAFLKAINNPSVNF